MSPDFVSLAALRHAIRRFLKAGEQAITDAGIEPQQYQLLLALKALLVQGEDTSIRVLAEQLLQTHNSTVGLLDRLEKRDLILRAPHPVDQRRVRIQLTLDGEDLIRRLAAFHQTQLQELGPELLKALGNIVEAVEARSS